MMQSGQRDGWRALAAGRRRRRRSGVMTGPRHAGVSGLSQGTADWLKLQTLLFGATDYSVTKHLTPVLWVHRRSCGDFLLRLPSLSPARLQIERAFALLILLFQLRLGAALLFRLSGCWIIYILVWYKGIVHSELIFYPFATHRFVGHSMYVGYGDISSSTQLGTLAGKYSTLRTQSGIPGRTK